MLSRAPYTRGADQLTAALSAQQAHDYRVETLTYPHKAEAYAFCRGLLAQRLGEDVAELDDDAVLGQSTGSPHPRACPRRSHLSRVARAPGDRPREPRWD